MLEVTIPNNPLMAGMLGSKEGVGVYMGCAACPFASPMMTRAK
jgi:xanthosine utilization system XapX-like protein